MVEKEKEISDADLKREYKKWASGRTGLTLDELVDAFSLEFGLTAEQAKSLKEALKKEEEEEERKRKEEEERKRKEEEERKRKEEEERKRKEEEERKRKEEEERKKKEIIPPRPRAEILAAFLNYAKGKTGFQLSQLIGMFAYFYKLTDVEFAALNEDVNKLVREQEEQKRKEEEERKKKEEEEKKKEEEKRRKEEEQKKKKKEEEEKKKKKVPEELLISRTPYPKWWKDSLNAKIDLTAPGSQVLATVSGNLRLFVSVIVITVTGETVITITFGNAGSSGPIYLGGESQPMGMVIAMGNSPAPCGNGGLSISATDPTDSTPSVGGWATCFAEEVIKQKV